MLDPISFTKMNLKAQLRAYIEERGITASELARRSGVTKQSISDWLAGAPPRNLDHVKKVAESLGTTVDHLCFGTSTQSEPSVDIEKLIGDGWIGGLFEVKLRRIKR